MVSFVEESAGSRFAVAQRAKPLAWSFTAGHLMIGLFFAVAVTNGNGSNCKVCRYMPCVLHTDTLCMIRICNWCTIGTWLTCVVMHYA